MKFLKLLNVLFYLLPLAAVAQKEISAVATDASCTGDGRADGTITITVKNVSEPIVYAVAKSPYDPANIIASSTSLITHLEAGDYFYGYYENNTFIKAATTIKVGSTYSSISPTIGLFTAKNYTYCASDPNPLGDIAINVEKGNPPYTVNLLNASDGTVVRSVQTATGIVRLNGMPSGQYKVSATDHCGTLISPVTVLNLPPNEVLKNFNLDKGTINAVDLIYNTPNDVCSGISSATLPNGLLAVSNGDAYFNALPPFYGVPNFIYKLEIQNGSGWDVYDNLSLTDVKKKYSMPSDRSKWGIVRLSATYCNITKTVELDYGASAIGIVRPFTDFEFSIEDDPLNTNCNDTGQVLLKNVPKDQGGCLPYTVEVTDNSTGIKNTYTITGINSLEICKLNIGKSYTIKVTDNTGIEITTYSFTNNTSNTFSKKPVITDPKNVFIDPNYFAPDKDIKAKIQFFTGPSALFFGKCALAVYPPMATPGYVGLQGKVTVSLISGPSPLTVTYKEPIFGLGNELLPGTYTIRIKDSACFDEEFQVVLDSYFTKIEITNVSFNPDASKCDRYNKNITIKVSAVGTGAINSTLANFYGNNQIFPGIVSGPAGMGTFNAILGSNSLKEGISNFSFFQDIAGKYEIGIARKFIGGRPLLQSELIENTQTAFVDVQPNFPTFDLSESGGIVCSGDTTGDLHTKVNNVSESITYFIKKETDSDFPTTGQSSPVFKGLTAGNYIVKAKTVCYEVLQPLILRSSFSQLINGGDRAVCIGGNIKLSVVQIGPVNSIKWTLPDGTEVISPELNINNVTAAQIGTYKVEINSLGGCYFTESINIKLGGLPTPTGNSTQQFCATAKATVADLITVETGIIWYDASTGGNIVPSSTLLIDGKTYYAAAKTGTCESTNRLAVTVSITDPKTPTGAATQQFCAATNATVADLAASGTGVIWYDAVTGGNIIPSSALLIDGKTYYAAAKTGTCESTNRLAITVSISDPKTPMGAATQQFCAATNATVADLTASGTGVIWYDALTGGNIIPSSTLLIDGKTYYAAAKTGTCESTNRLAVTVSISDPKTPTGAATQQFCAATNATVADLAASGTGVIWYDALTGGNIIPSSTLLIDGKTYYAATKTSTCESTNRLAVTVSISDPKTPTGTATQQFCAATNATVADLAASGTGVIWYDALTGGSIIPSTTLLIDGKTYYGATKSGTCESTNRLTVTVSIADPVTPTGAATQQFCAATNATVADLAASGTGVIWYDALTGGNIIPSTTLLIDGKTYYGAAKSGTCESTNRLTVTVIVKNDLPDKDPDWLTSVCISEKVTYTTVAGMSSYNWLVSNEGTIVNGGQHSDDFVTVLWNHAGNGAVEVNYIDEAKCNPLVSINFSIEVESCLKPSEDADIEIRKTVNNPMANIGQQVVFTISAENLGGNNFNNVQIRDILPSGYMYTSSKTSSGDYSITTGIWNLSELLAHQTETLTITAKVKATGDYLNIAFLENSTPEDHNPLNNKAQAGITNPEVIVFNMVSPNGDGKNDYFEIRGLERFPNNSVTIYNSWGVIVFETTNYGAKNNFFRGISEGRATVNQNAGLPSGTYFYVLSYGNGALMIEKSGYLHLTLR
ncbi:gliding motility-associated C-terminal domain-containing protein [Flavobacterium tructae]|uniref:Ig-like domain-containing protein n=1 Tax=Flavobacterium tructae TaxID=1114873 RepID=UPI0035A96476